MPHIFFDEEISPKCLLTTRSSALKLRCAASGRSYSFSYVTFEAPTAVITETTVFLNVMPCGLVDRYQTAWHHIQQNKNNNIILNSVLQHNHFFTQGNYKAQNT